MNPDVGKPSKRKQTLPKLTGKSDNDTLTTALSPTLMTTDEGSTVRIGPDCNGPKELAPLVVTVGVQTMERICTIAIIPRRRISISSSIGPSQSDVYRGCSFIPKQSATEDAAHSRVHSVSIRVRTSACACRFMQLLFIRSLPQISTIRVNGDGSVKFHDSTHP